jgi:hypothetical protein
MQQKVVVQLEQLSQPLPGVSPAPACAQRIQRPVQRVLVDLLAGTLMIRQRADCRISASVTARGIAYAEHQHRGHQRQGISSRPRATSFQRSSPAGAAPSPSQGPPNFRLRRHELASHDFHHRVSVRNRWLDAWSLARHSFTPGGPVHPSRPAMPLPAAAVRAPRSSLPEPSTRGACRPSFDSSAAST